MKEARLRTTFFLLLLGGALLLTFFIVRPYLVTLAVAATAAVILHPLHEWLLSKTGNRPSVAAFLMVVLTILLLLIPLTLLGVTIAAEATNLYAALSGGTLPVDLLGQLEDLLRHYLPGVSLNLNEYAGQGLQWIASNLQSFFAGTIRAVFLVFLGIIAYYFLLKDGKRFMEALIDLSPLTDKEDRQLILRLRAAVNSVIRGSLIIAVLQGVTTGIGLLIFDVPSAVLLGSLAGVGALIPTIGTSIVLVPTVLYLVFTGQYFSAAGLTVWGALAVGMIDNVLHPMLVGRGMRMHPLFIFLAVIGGIGVFGMAGFILGPLAVSLLFGLLDIFRMERTA